MGGNDSNATTRLEAEARALGAALAELGHEARRVRDQLERRGGRSFTLEARLRQLQENASLTRWDLDRIRERLAGETGGA